MTLTFTFDLSQQHFELRCENRSRRLSSTELSGLIEHCEQHYYSGRSRDMWGRQQDDPTALMDLGQQLYRWLDGEEGWLRGALATGLPQTLVFQLDYNRELLGLNPETDRLALGLAHLPWELLHDGREFLLQTQRLTMPPMRIVQRREGAQEPINRPLHLLLMATAPETVEPVLSYEQEEANIIQATEKQPLLLAVEESGSVAELGNLVRSYGTGYFDIFHLTGHGLIYDSATYGDWFAQRMGTPPSIADNTPCFITEDEVGQLQLTTVPDLARAFGERFPRMVFLSGCHTGEVPDRGNVPSMAQALVQAGAQIVLGWARPVLEQTAIVAAKALYRELAAGGGLEAAVQAAVADMIQAKCPDWHLLRVYRDARPVEALVTPLNTRGRERLRRIAPEGDFLDAQDRVKVAGAYGFVGRRRPLQRCLQVMKPTSDQIGVFIQGMGGLGKSTLAARLCRRVEALHPNTQRVVLVGVVNEATLLQKLSSAYERFPELPELLNQPQLSLAARLTNFIEAVEDRDRPLLLVLDDFEQNISPAAISDGTLRPIGPAAEVLTAMCGALATMQQEVSARSRLIVTCRYKCPFPTTLRLERLQQMNAADITKKCRLLPDFTQVRIHPSYDRVLQVAQGNPRLLEWLLQLLQQPDLDTDALLNRLEAEEDRFREDILAETLLATLTDNERQFLAKLSVFQLPVPETILVAVAPDVMLLSKTLALSLVESATTPNEPEYRVTGILTPLLNPLLTQDGWKATAKQAAQATYRSWWEGAKTSTEAQQLEMVRLALAGDEAEIAASMGTRVATNWVNRSRFVEALNLCQRILLQFSDYRVLGTIARAEEVLGETRKAIGHYQQALEHCPDDDLKIKAATLSNMAGVIAQQGEVDHALSLWQQALEINEQIADFQGKAATFSNMAGVIAQQGEVDRALSLWQQALDILERIGDVRSKAATLNQMAVVVAQQGEVDHALSLWQQALGINERIGDVQGKAATLSNMAWAIARQGEVDHALNLWQQALDIDERIGDARGKAATLSNMAWVIAQQGKVDRALSFWQQALDILERIGDVQGKAATLSDMAGVIAQQGEVDRALDLWQQALDIKEQIGDVRGKAATLSDMAGVIAQQGEVDRALNLWQQALDILERIGDVQGKAVASSNMAYTVGEAGDKTRQLNLNLQAAQALGQIRAYSDLFTVLGNLGATAETHALSYFAQAVWLSLWIQAPFIEIMLTIKMLFERVPQGDALKALLAAYMLSLCAQRGQEHLQFEQLQQLSLELLSEAVGAQGITSQEAFKAWFAQQQLNDPSVFLSRLKARLEELIGDQWAFERF